MHISSHHVKSGFLQTMEMDGLLTKQGRNECNRNECNRDSRLMVNSADSGARGNQLLLVCDPGQAFLNLSVPPHSSLLQSGSGEEESCFVRLLTRIRRQHA